MHAFTQLSIEYASQRSYLDDLFRVYPTIPEGIREIDTQKWERVELFFEEQNNPELLSALLEFDLFPIKDSYVAYLRRDPTAIRRNPQTVNRICGRLYEMGLNEIYRKCSEAKETNRQMGPMFRSWLAKGSLGLFPVELTDFVSTTDNAILAGSDHVLATFATDYLNYSHSKGLDFVLRFNGRYVIGEAKFLTDFGGHQNAQFNDAITTAKTHNVNALIIAVLDGVLYIKGNNKLYREIATTHAGLPIMSALVLREFLYQL